MAKTKTASRRRGDGADIPDEANGQDLDELLGEAPPEAAPAPPRPPAPPAPLRVETLSIEIPIAEQRPESRRFSHVDGQLTPEQGRTLMRIFLALDGRHARMANGQHVNAGIDVIRWLLDQAFAQGE